MKKAYIFGKGGHAHVIASFLTADVTFVVTGAAPGGSDLPEEDFFTRNPPGDVYIGIGDNAARSRIFNRLMGLGRTPATCVAPGAFIARDAALGAGALVCAGAVIGARASLGDNTIVNTLSSVDHDGVLGDHSSVTVGVTFGGNVRTGVNCFFGLKSAVLPGIVIGDNVQVAAGSLVTKPVPDNVMVGGSPARLIRTRHSA